ncbi:TRAP-type mannitol/chloroaromatic compound transport system, small permease component [Meinhardsimonia xiamenensis]|jgi:TRAP-type mannitol/chloroaromatic compound transport system permease small subunit/exonuclease VII small subunit|uniref:TRAP transporter small permease protein n=1 Tax=Meinhardsimonia xiamenensis TaxID=990712 RepID=A0A1G8YNB5_9RHOB|nr:TRAP transporter small permease subunit [Meinhardsimonia xiamenensis]PRX37373.1 TRAP-type mannitol/chloroaromatic compound transport system permease small subunit [Meinhardsimonia xiamenensis]SDK04339.1 TRAP-type mannitol/chloroaromatic compound transport system, small permease component [Meinhardsimonia xiamenensis]
MPHIDFTLPHWAYWVGLIVFPLIAMVMARRPRPEVSSYSPVLAYFILITGGMMGLHRFYLRNLWGLVYVPLLVFVLIANANEREARSAYSDALNVVRVAERTLERERPRLESARQEIERLKAEIGELEEGSFALRSAQRKLERAEERLKTGQERIAQAEADLAAALPAEEAAAERRAFWNSAARYTFYLILALMAVDAVLIPGLVRRANASIDREAEAAENAAIRAAVEAQEAVESRRADHEFAENWIDKLSLYAGEFVSYWAVIAVFVYYFEVISRYLFNSPTSWAHESMYLMFGMQYLIAGAYAMLTEAHVRVDVFYAPLSRPKKAWADLFTSIFFFIFAGTLLVTSYTFAMDAIAVPSGNAVISDWARGEIGFGEMLSQLSLEQWTDPNIRWGEISFNEWEIPLWPMKWVMVIGALLLILQGISKLAKDIRAIREGA